MKCAAAILIIAILMLSTMALGDSPSNSLQVTATERQFFQLGDQLGQAAFAYADLAHESGKISRTSASHHQVQQLAALAPLADRSRATALAGFQQALDIMVSLHAPAPATKPVRSAVDRLNKPVALAGDARLVAMFSDKAARTLGALDEFNALSSVPYERELQHWLTSPLPGPSAHVWFAEGLIGALVQIAAADQMPDLLPPVKEVATDLRGLQDWLTLRLPDSPTADQIALGSSIDAFLRDASRTGTPQTAHLSATQLQALSDISRQLQAQLAGIEPMNTPAQGIPPAG